jgi:dTDP-4-amino-4,6-dideoxygalactose transaminase
MQFLKQNQISAPFHYLPLHTSPAGIRHGRFHGEDRYTSLGSSTLIRLPLYYGMKDESVQFIIQTIRSYLNQKEM